MFKKYKLRFDIWGALLFLIIMIPNFIWFAVPAPNDILRQESITPLVDTIGSVCQIIFVAALCIVINKERDSIRISPLLISSAVCIGLYFLGWVLYYNGIVNPMVIIYLTLPPCVAFILFALDRKNFIALIPAACFTICHLIYGIANFIL